MGQKHVRALDGVRGIAVLLVLIYHFGYAAGFSGWLAKISNGAWIGVDLFFVLSGFLITGILLDNRTAPQYFRTFYARRILRIIPIYYGITIVCVLLSLFVPSVHGLWREQGWLWLYGTNVKVALANDWVLKFGWVEVNHFWSLAVEEHFYLVWPAIVLWLSPRRLLIVCFILIVLALGCRVVLDFRNHYIAAYALTPCRIDSLASGAIVAILMRDPRGRDLLRAWIPPILFVCLAAAAVINYRGRGGWIYLMRFGVVYFDALAGIFAAMVWFAVTVDPSSLWGGVLGCRPLVAVGRWSYGIYLYHVFVRNLIPNGLPPLIVFFGGIAASILIAAASWRCIEEPINRQKNRFQYGG